MKRIKIFLSGLLFALLCFALVGCAGTAGEYFPSSLDCNFYVYNSLGEISVSYSFDVTAPSLVNYDVKYTVTVYHGNKRINSKEVSKTLTPSEDKTRTISGYYDFDYNTSGIEETNLRLTVTDVTVTPKEQTDEYRSYAIGFGSAGGAVLIACTVLFIVLKVKEEK